MTKRTERLILTATFERIEETTPERPSRPVVDTTGEAVEELPSRPGLRAARPNNVVPLRRVAG